MQRKALHHTLYIMTFLTAVNTKLKPVNSRVVKVWKLDPKFRHTLDTTYFASIMPKIDDSYLGLLSIGKKSSI